MKAVIVLATVLLVAAFAATYPGRKPAANDTRSLLYLAENVNSGTQQPLTLGHDQVRDPGVVGVVAVSKEMLPFFELLREGFNERGNSVRLEAHVLEHGIVMPCIVSGEVLVAITVDPPLGTTSERVGGDPDGEAGVGVTIARASSRLMGTSRSSPMIRLSELVAVMRPKRAGSAPGVALKVGIIDHSLDYVFSVGFLRMFHLRHVDNAPAVEIIRLGENAAWIQAQSFGLILAPERLTLGGLQEISICNDMFSGPHQFSMFGTNVYLVMRESIVEYDWVAALIAYCHSADWEERLAKLLMTPN